MHFNTPKLLPLAIATLCLLVSCKKETKIEALGNKLADSATVNVSTQNTSSPITTAATPSNATGASNSDAAKLLLPAACCKTRNVIIVVIDGPRFSETWGDYTKQNIPQRYNLYGQGVLLGNFKNNGTTNTDSGHDAICTGNYENLENWGQQLPQYPSIFQSWLKASGQPAEKAWIITSKDKLQILANCRQEEWADKYQPRTDCGKNGAFTGYRLDDTTMARAAQVMQTYHPNLMLINFKDPDFWAHGNQWNKYINGIKTTDAYIGDIYRLIQSDDQYKDKTTLIVTNDHGRHTNGVATGFMDHGDGCEDCRHIEFFAVGPDFKKGIGLHNAYEQIDISATVAKLLNFKMEYGKGKVITEIFQ